VYSALSTKTIAVWEQSFFEGPLPYDHSPCKHLELSAADPGQGKAEGAAAILKDLKFCAGLEQIIDFDYTFIVLSE
jgi:hypothetical protein